MLEFELSGVASAGTTWLALAYAPTGALNAYRVGDRLSDGVIKSIESTDIVVETDEGPMRLPVATARCDADKKKIPGPLGAPGIDFRADSAAQRTDCALQISQDTGGAP